VRDMWPPRHNYDLPWKETPPCYTRKRKMESGMLVHPKNSKTTSIFL
jgi:hypothetical protein